MTARSARATLCALCALAALVLTRDARGEVGIPEGGDGGEGDHPVHVTLDAAATYGIGGNSALGVQLHALGQLSLWNTRHATGSFDFGLVLGWQDEPESLQYAVPVNQDNDAQRLNVWATAGHSFHMGRRRRATLGLHLFTGWTHVWSTATVNDDQLDLHRSASENYGLFNAGGMLKFDCRFSRYIGAHLQIAAPFPVGSSYVNTLFHVGLGLTAYLR